MTASTIEKTIRADLHSRHSTTFDGLLSRWEHEFGTQAVKPLLSLAADPASPDPDRYVALMGATKIGGSEMAPALVPFLKDPSWMLRSGGLRALRALKNPKTASAALPLLKDRALVVRAEAVEALQVLHPAGTEQALAEAATDPSNFHRGKAQWVPQKALDALVALKARFETVGPRLARILDMNSDPALQKRAVRTLEALKGKVLAPKGSFAEKIRQWKSELRKTS